MSLHNGIDTVSYLTVGQYTKTYSSAVGQAILLRLWLLCVDISGWD
jgi:hypothetical protein